MEPKVNYIVVGAFVVVLAAAVLGVVLWLGKSDYRGVYDRYYAYMRESVSGLSVNSAVKYRGVDVGRVKDIVLSPENPEEVRLTLDILHGTPIKTDTVAVLETQGLTGLATLDLTGGTRDAPALEASKDQEYPVIKTGPSLFFRLDTVISRLLEDQGLTKLLTNLNQLSRQATAVIDEDNRAALRRILKDLSEVTQTLAARHEQVDKGLLNASQSAENLAKMTETINKQMPILLERVNKSAEALQVMTEELAKTGKTVSGLVQETRPDLQEFSRNTLAETGLLVSELRQLTGTLNRLAQDLEREPNALVLGRTPRPKGPGE
ncbi:MAG TPA: MlaD family protein [Nitrospira sp.]|jgi:phospholipid/cholesterol/gamma-HCH transport system substrate-binding protein|nr:MlaD family protein [Nitrospira sp.]